jgi:hypothetical protein
MEDETPDTGDVPTNTTQTFTPAQRIAELNDIDRSVSTLLSAASDAVAILSNSPSNEKHQAALRNATTARAAFSTAAETYFSTLSSIEVRLRRQVYALEEAELIKSGNERDARRGRAPGSDASTARTGAGPLDPTWLNARANDRVGLGKKKELLAQARAWVEKNEQQNELSMDNDRED